MRCCDPAGPALLFERPDGYNIPCLTNLFGTPERVALGMGSESVAELRDIGRMLASLKEPEPPRGLKDAGKLLQMAKALWDMKPVDAAPRALPGGGASRTRTSTSAALPVQTCWPGDAGPLHHLGPGGHPRAAERWPRRGCARTWASTASR